jgi:hypothetical protein
MRAVKASKDEVVEKLKSLEHLSQSSSSASRRARNRLEAFAKDENDQAAKKPKKEEDSKAAPEPEAEEDDPELAMMKAMGFATTFSHGKKT